MNEESTMTIGPVEYVVISFPGNQFHGEIAPALAELVRRARFASSTSHSYRKTPKATLPRRVRRVG
jgi:hypothetical protein